MVLLVGTDEFNTHPLRNCAWADLHEIQQWAATKLGWSQESWNGDTHVPGSLASLAEYDLPGARLQEQLLHWMGFPENTVGSRYFTGDHISAHYLATRILRYSVKTCVWEIEIASSHYPLLDSLTHTAQGVLPGRWPGKVVSGSASWPVFKDDEIVFTEVIDEMVRAAIEGREDFDVATQVTPRTLKSYVENAVRPQEAPGWLKYSAEMKEALREALTFEVNDEEFSSAGAGWIQEQERMPHPHTSTSHFTLNLTLHPYPHPHPHPHYSPRSVCDWCWLSRGTTWTQTSKRHSTEKLGDIWSGAAEIRRP